MSGSSIGAQVAEELERIAGLELEKGELRYAAELKRCAAAARRDHLRAPGWEYARDVLAAEYGGLPPGVVGRLSELVR